MVGSAAAVAASGGADKSVTLSLCCISAVTNNDRCPFIVCQTRKLLL